jgi:hypothetical protein
MVPLFHWTLHVLHRLLQYIWRVKLFAMANVQQHLPVA